jgi:hypothetical protein
VNNHTTARSKNTNGGQSAKNANKGIVSIPRNNSLGYGRTFQMRFSAKRPLIQSANVGGVGGEIVFALQDATNYASYATVFDWFQIEKVRVKFKPSSMLVNNGNSSSAIQSIAPLFAAAIDTNAIAYTPSSLAVVQEYATSKTVNANEHLTLVFKPCSLLTGYATAGTSFYAVNTAPLRTADSATYHYGVVWYMEQPGGANPPAGVFSYDVDLDYWVTFYNQK